MKFESLVSYATSGEMHESEVQSIIESLKKEKVALMKRLSKMPVGKKRKEGYKNLHKSMMRLYNAVSYKIEEGKNGLSTKKVYKPVSALANMILCYDKH